MQMIPVDSSNVSAVGYDEDDSVLQVEFHNGGTYQYFDVPLQVFVGLRDADSVGRFLNQQIKGTYRYSRL